MSLVFVDYVVWFFDFYNCFFWKVFIYVYYVSWQQVVFVMDYCFFGICINEDFFCYW